MSSPITVKQLGRYLQRELLTDPFLNDIVLIGEVTSSSINKYSYFTLSEDDENISCVYFGNDIEILSGEKIIVYGRVNLYLRDSKYQIIVNKIENAGIGQSYIELIKLKEKLEKKGYFNLDNKKNIPKIPYKIGLVSGLNSAAYYDFIRVIKDNNYNCSIYFYDALVQGKNAELDIKNALQYLDTMNLDLIILTRGGGSKDDLSVFNSEIIADTIFELNTPIITAIGHDIDISIADYVSDLSLQTPTKVAEYITQEFIKLKENFAYLYNNISSLIERKIIKSEADLSLVNSKIIRLNPIYNIQNKIQELEDYRNGIYFRISSLIENNKDNISLINDSINKSYKSILNKNQFFVKDGNNYVDAKNLKVNKSYQIINENVKYKILVEEKIDEW